MIHNFTYFFVLVKIRLSHTNKSIFIINSNRAHIGQATFTRYLCIPCTTKTRSKLIIIVHRFTLLTHLQSKFSHLTMTFHTVHLSNSQCDPDKWLKETSKPPNVTLLVIFHPSHSIPHLSNFSPKRRFLVNFYLSWDRSQMVSNWTSSVYMS